MPYNLTKEARLESCEVVNTVEVYNAIIGKQERQLQLGQEREGLGNVLVVFWGGGITFSFLHCRIQKDAPPEHKGLVPVDGR